MKFNTIVEVYGDAKKQYVTICKYIPCKDCFDCYAERETVLTLDRKGIENLISDLERHIRYQNSWLEEEVKV